MADNYLTHNEESGTIHIAEDVVAMIVADSVREIEGVGSMSQNSGEQRHGKKVTRSIRIEEDGDAVIVDIYLMVRYGFAIPEVAQKVQEKVASTVSDMTGFPVRSVNVHVSGISFND